MSACLVRKTKPLEHLWALAAAVLLYYGSGVLAGLVEDARRRVRSRPAAVAQVRPTRYLVQDSPDALSVIQFAHIPAMRAWLVPDTTPGRAWPALVKMVATLLMHTDACLCVARVLSNA